MFVSPLRGLAVALGCLGLAAPAAAQTTYTWTGAGNGNWSDPNNWDVNGVPPTSLTNTDVLFAGTASLVNTLDLVPNGSFNIRSLTFDSSAGTFNITPTNTNVTTLRIGALGITNNSTNSQTMTNPVALGASQTWNAAAGPLFFDAPVTATGQTLTFDGANTITLSQSAALTGGTVVKNGTGTTVLSANNTPTGVTVNQGTLVVNKVGTGSPIGTGPVTLAGGTLSFQVFGNPVAATGYNHDVVTAVSESAANGGTSPFGTTRAVDGSNGTGSFVYFQAGVNTANPTFGLPASGRFTSGGVNYQFQDYTGNNVLSLGNANSGNSTGTLTLVTPGAYRSLNIMNVAGNGPAPFSFTLNFDSGNPTTVTGLTSLDWFGGANPVFTVNGRLNRTTGGFDSVGSGNPRIYTTNFTLSAADQLRNLVSITFNTSGTNGYTFNVFGFSGTAGSNTQVFSNPVTVTADSTLDQQNVASITVGPLSVGTNTLTVTGTASGGTTMFTGAVTLSGNPTFATQGTATLALGPLNDGGSARTITQTGGGFLTLTAPATSLVAGTTVNVTGGTLGMTAAGALGTQATVSLSPGTTLNTTANQTVAALSGTGGVVTLNGSTLTVGGGTAAAFNGAVTGGALVVSGAGTVQTFSGYGSNPTSTTVQSGAQLVSATGRSVGSGPITLTGTSTLTVGGGNSAPITVTGFGGTGTGWNLQGNNVSNPTVTGDALTITTATNGIANSAWYATPVPVGGPFTATFRYSQSNNTNPADGITFGFQNASPTAVGGAGGGLGYTGITQSAALAVNIYSGAGNRGFALAGNGAVGGFVDVSPVGLLTAQPGNEVTFTLNYDGVNLSGTVTQGSNSFTIPPTAVAIASFTGPTAFLGFTGGTGGLNAQQVIDQFSYTTPDLTVYPAPVTVAAGANAALNVIATSTFPTVTINSLTIGPGATVSVGADPSTPAGQVYGLTIGTAMLNGPVTLAVTNNGTATGTLTLGAVGGTGGITKTGNGVLAIAGTGSYTGNTTVSAGTFVLTGSGSFASSPVITVQSGATLDVTGVTGGANFAGTGFALASGQTLTGTGTVAGPLGVSSGAVLSPGGTTTGTLTSTGGLKTAAGGRLSIGIGGGSPSATPGASTQGTLPNPTTNTFIDITGGTTAFDPGTVFTVTMSGVTTSGAYSYEIARGAGDQSGLLINNQSQFSAVGFSGSNFSVTGNASGAVFLSFTAAVPEPGSVLALAAGAAAIARSTRRRNRPA
jgi:autotransporter-associated beta strand protein